MDEELQPVGPYLTRMRRALAFVEANLGNDVNVATLAEVAGVSLFHFHRQFAAMFGIGVARYVQLLRLKRASMRLLEGERVLDVAIAHGYGSHEAFARAFKSAMGQTPSAFRDAPDWERWHEVFENPLSLIRTKTMSHDHSITLETLPETPIAELLHVGPQQRVMASVQKFIAWRKAAGMSPSRTRTFNIVYDDVREVAPADYRFGLGVSLEGRQLPANDSGVVTSSIAGGRYAVMEHQGTDAELFASVDYLYSVWLERSGETLRDAPLVVERLDIANGTPESEARARVYLPLE